MSHRPIKYRPDVDGLRAIAVLAVVLYHLGFEAVPGGFVGVDVFFVISGFLITSILLRDIERQRFSIAEFYARRVRRIIPPLIVVAGASLLVGFFVLLPQDFETLGKSAVAAVVFASNILFWQTQDYFDASAETNALLHTWSLAVEEQFYIFFPVLLYILTKAHLSRAVWFSAIAVASLLLSIVGVRYFPESTFYLLPSRIWELLCGALIALAGTTFFRPGKTNALLSWIGIIAILVSVLLVNSGMLFPGETAIPVCLGTALIIHAGQGDAKPFINRILAHKACVFVGLISYSMYLWHWPAIIFTEYYLIRELTTVEKFLGLALITAISYASWRWVEQPFRDRESVFYTDRRLVLFSTAALSSAVVGAVGLWLHATNGLPQRLPDSAQKIAEAQNDISPVRRDCHSSIGRVIAPDAACVYGDLQSHATIAVWGDSHTVELAYALGELAGERRTAVRHFSSSSCLPAYQLSTPSRPFCQEVNDQYARFIAMDDKVEKVVLVAFYRSYRQRHGPEMFDGLARSIELLQSFDKQVYVLLPVPFPESNVPRAAALVLKYDQPLSRLDIGLSHHMDDHADIISSLEALEKTYGVTLIDPTNALCDRTVCRATDAQSANFFDRHHLSLTGARKVALTMQNTIFR